MLSYLAIEEGRWDAVMWIVKAIVELDVPEKGRLEDMAPFGTISWDGHHDSLWSATNQPITTQRTGPGVPFQHTLEQLTDLKPASYEGINFRNAALGQIWRSLGNLVLIAVGDRPQEKDAIMAHVLELLAHLHHAGIIPESVYHYEPPKDSHSLQQPPTLYLLSSRILTALSDAAWSAHESTQAASKSQAQYTFLGQEIPGSRFKVRTPELGTEVWLELVLWSCLHGGWVTDGAAILKKLMTYDGDVRWSVLHWSNFLEDRAASSFREMTWTDLWSFARARGTQANSPDRFVVEKTISREVVAAFVDRLLDTVQVGVGQRGIPFADVCTSVSTLKGLLSRDNLGLGTSTWDSVLARFLEGGGINADTEAESLEELLEFTSLYDKETEYHNALHKHQSSPDSPFYILDPSAISLGVLHQALLIHLKNGNFQGTFRVIEKLQLFTDENKKRSIQKFFEKLNDPSDTGITAPESFSSNIPSPEYPAYFPQIPPRLLTGVLTLATKNQEFEFANQLLYAGDFDGPLIPEELYGRGDIAAAIINYAVAANDDALISRIVEFHSRMGLSLELVEALLETYLQDEKWGAVEKVISALVTNKVDALVARVGALIAKHLLLLQHKFSTQKQKATKEDNSLTQTVTIFRKLLKARFGKGDEERLSRFHGILCVLATVGPEWRRFSSSLLVFQGPRILQHAVIAEDFARLLQGVTKARGSHEAMKLMLRWCKDVSKARTMEPKHQMPWKRQVTLPKPLSHDMTEIVVDMGSDTNVILRGELLSPTLPLMRIVYQSVIKKFKHQLATVWRAEQTREILHWAVRGFVAMGLNDAEINYELGGVVDLEVLRAETRKKARGLALVVYEGKQE